MDFVLEMYAKDNPETFRFSRGGEEAPTKAAINASWERVLIGKAHDSFIGRFIDPRAMAGLRDWMTRNKNALRFMRQRARTVEQPRRK